MLELTSLRAKKRMRRIAQERIERPSKSTSGRYWLMQENLRYSASFLSSWSFNRYFPLAGMVKTFYRDIAGVDKQPQREGVCVFPTYFVLCDWKWVEKIVHNYRFVSSWRSSKTFAFPLSSWLLLLLLRALMSLSSPSVLSLSHCLSPLR